jgi:hypothetical protein
MSRHSAKAAGRSAKNSRTTAKKSTNVTSKPAVKSARGAKKASISARQPVGKTATKAASKTAAKSAVKTKTKSPSVTPSLPIASSPAPMLRTISPPVQPIVVPDVPVRAHKYNVGETVYYTSPSFGRAAASGSYTVVKLLPSDGDDYQYRIKSSGEAFERVAKESQLDRA